MIDEITGDQVLNAVECVIEHALSMRDELNRLDAEMGDGDTGITVSKAANGLRYYLEIMPPIEDLGEFFFDAGRAVNNAAPSTLGTIMATALMSAGRAVKGKTKLDTEMLRDMLFSANHAVQERGKAKPGDKTIVDVLHPAEEAFSNAVVQGKNIRDAGTLMLQAAREGRDKVLPIRSKIGRAAWVGERTENKPDPGTVLLVQALETVMGEDYSEPGSTLD